MVIFLPLSASIVVAANLDVLTIKNNILINIIKWILPNGAEAWHLVELATREESREDAVLEEEDFCRNWTRKLCNNFKKPTEATGENADRILRYIEIEQRIHHRPIHQFWGHH